LINTNDFFSLSFKTPVVWELESLYYGEGNGTPLQYACLENPMDRGTWKAAVHGVSEGWI